MRINLFTAVKNNESELKNFVEWYKSKVPNINIFVYDCNSTDNSMKKAKELGTITYFMYDQYESKEDWKNECWKHKPCDCVIIVDIDEYLELTPNLFKNSTIIHTKAYRTDTLQNPVQSPENRLYERDKYCIFDPLTIKEMNFEKDNCSPNGFIRVGEIEPIMWILTKTNESAQTKESNTL